MLEISFQGQRLILHPFKALFWLDKKILLIADLHLGKALHFRKAGIPVPSAVSQTNWDKLISLLFDFKPKRVLFLGDLFHSDYNDEWNSFCQIMEQFSFITFELIQGNHDILPEEVYSSANLVLHKEPLLIQPFIFSHHPMEKIPTPSYNLSGHIHPCVRLRGSARQRHKLPCFFFSKNKGLLPAFGAFTGMAYIQPKRGDQVFVITEDAVLEV